MSFLWLVTFPVFGDVDRLLEAIGSNDVSYVKDVLENGLNPETTDNNGDPLLFAAVRSRSVDIVKLLLSYGADPNARTKRFGISVLLSAVTTADCDAEILATLISSGADINTKLSGAGYNPILMATYVGSTECIKVLIDSDADLNAVDDIGRNVVINAITAGNMENLKLLIEHGANLETESTYYPAPIEYARQLNELEMVRYLQEVKRNFKGSEYLKSKKQGTAQGTGVLEK